MSASYWKGLRLSLLLHLLQIPIAIVWFFGLIAIDLIFDPPFLRGVSGIILIIGPLYAFIVTQFLYLLPAIAIAFRRGHTEVGKGLITGTALSFLLSSACWTSLYGTDSFVVLWRMLTLQWVRVQN